MTGFACFDLPLEELPLDHLLMGITLLLLRAPVGQQSSLLSLGTFSSLAH